jgi:hypothetical protein
MYPCYFPTYSEVGGIPKGFLDATLDTTQNTTTKGRRGGRHEAGRRGGRRIAHTYVSTTSQATQASEARPAVTEPAVQSCLSFQMQRGAHDAAPVLVLLR